MQSLKISVKIGAQISTLSLSNEMLIPVVVFFGSNLLISNATSSESTISNLNVPEKIKIRDLGKK